MKNNLNKLTKTDLLNIISKMKKNDLIQIISGGGNGEILQQTNNAIRTAIDFNISKIKKNNKNIAMANNELYKNMYKKTNSE